KGPLLILIHVCDRTAGERQSEVCIGSIADPAVRREDVQLCVVVHVKEPDAPSPTGTIRMAIADLCESAVSIVMKKRITFADHCAHFSPPWSQYLVTPPILAA